jgi:hypothetical protein
VAAYGFGEGTGTSVHDRSAAALDGTVVGGAAWVAQGRFGSALRFDGVDDRVDVAPAPALSPTSALTIEAWVRPAAGTGWRTLVLKERTGGLAYALYVNEATTRPNVTINIGGTDWSVTGPTGLPVGSWSHVAATYDGTRIRLFVGAVEVASRVRPGTVTPSSGPLRIGGNSIWGARCRPPRRCRRTRDPSAWAG